MMSEQPGGAFVDDAFASIMDTMVEDEAPGTEGAPAAAPGGPAGASDPAAAPVPGAAGEAGAPASLGQPDPNLGADAPAVGSTTPAVAGGDPGAEGAADAGPDGGDRVPAWTVDFATVSADLGGLSQKFEETTTQAFQQQALETIREEYAPYFDSLKQHPRMLVGTEVPSLSGEQGQMETLRDADDAREWQDAVKSLLTDEVRERATAAMEENQDILNTVHASIELFTNNKDLVPGTRQFDRALADRFAAMASPYELRVDGKLHGYTIPVQPLIDQLRAQLGRERAAAPPAPAAAATAPSGRARRPADPPQAGLGSKAGSASDAEEDFSTLFGTLGLPNLRI